MIAELTLSAQVIMQGLFFLDRLSAPWCQLFQSTMDEGVIQNMC